MRTTNLILSLAALAGVAFLLVRDGEERTGEKGVRAVNVRIDALELQMQALTEDVRVLLEEREDAGPRLLTSSSPEQLAIEKLNRRAAALEKTLAELGEAVAQPDVPPKAKPVPRKTKPADPAVVDGWLEKLEHESNDIVFSATIELARLGDLRATFPLIRVLEEHADFYARLGAATALGQLRAVDAVAALIEGLDEKDELVRTASAEALKQITGKDFRYRAGAAAEERLEIQGKYREWWREHGDEVAERLRRER